MENAAKVPEHIIEKSKEFAWSAISADDNYRKQRQFAYYIYDKNFFVPYHSFNFDLHDLACEMGIHCLSHLNSYLKPLYKEGMIEGFVTLVDIYRNKRQSMKAGKYLKKVFPFATDAQIEKGVAYLKDANSLLEFELIECDKAESFEYAYKTPHVPKQSPKFDNGKDYYLKRLDSSCMRGENFEGWSQHPAIVYGYGDLRILYAKEKLSGKIGARVIIYPAKMSCSDIYTANDSASELLVNYLMENGYSADGISGARISKIQKHGDEYLMPYVDGTENYEDCGNYFLLDSGSLRCCSTEGIVYLAEMGYCTDCEESYPEEDLTPIGDSCVCRGCRSNNYSYSYLMREYIPDGEAVTCGGGDTATSYWFDSHGYILDVNCEYQPESDCVYYDEEYYYVNHPDVIYLEGTPYHKDSDEYQEAIAEKELRDSAYQVKVTLEYGWKDIPESNIYGNTQPLPTMGLWEIKERTLRDNYQINSNGQPERIADFLDLLEIA